MRKINNIRKPIKESYHFYTVKGLHQIENINDELTYLTNLANQLLDRIQKLGNDQGYSNSNQHLIIKAKEQLSECTKDYCVYTNRKNKLQQELLLDLSEQLQTNIQSFIRY